MNKIYFVYEPDENTGVIVATDNRNQAKVLGSLEMYCSYIDVRARLVKGGDRFYDDMENRDTGIEITGKGPIETNFQRVLDWEFGFKKLIMDMGRGVLFDELEAES